jgi:hypothetical protein
MATYYKLIEYAEGLDDIHAHVKATDVLKMVQDVIKKHGKNVYLDFDAGYNNICVGVCKAIRNGNGSL